MEMLSTLLALARSVSYFCEDCGSYPRQNTCYDHCDATMFYIVEDEFTITSWTYYAYCFTLVERRYHDWCTKYPLGDMTSVYDQFSFHIYNSSMNATTGHISHGVSLKHLKYRCIGGMVCFMFNQQFRSILWQSSANTNRTNQRDWTFFNFPVFFLCPSSVIICND